MHHQRVQFAKGCVVEEQVDAFARGEGATGVLLCDAGGSSSEERCSFRGSETIAEMTFDGGWIVGD